MTDRSLASSLASLVGLALKRAPGLREGQSIPRIEAQPRRVTIDAAWLAAYRRVTGGVDDNLLPPLAPQVLAVDLHVGILKDARFPLSALGTVHLENRIEELAPIAANATLEITAYVEGQRQLDKGIAYDLVTETRVDGAVASRAVMTALSRTKGTGDRKRSDRTEEPFRRVTSSSVVRVPASMGRSYARVSGDANPIHMYGITAKAFGFPRAIAHGAWTLARALNEVHDQLPKAPRVIEARFIRPVFLPSQVVVELGPEIDGARSLRVDPLRPGAPHILARITDASRDTRA